MTIQQLSMEEIEIVSGGVDGATAVSYGVGLGTSVAIGASLGPVGMAVGGAVFTISYLTTRALM